MTMKHLPSFLGKCSNILWSWNTLEYTHVTRTRELLLESNFECIRLTASNGGAGFLRVDDLSFENTRHEIHEFCTNRQGL